MTGSEYVKDAMRTNDKKGTDRLLNVIQKHNFVVTDKVSGKTSDFVNDGIDVGGVLNACLGLSGEVGELNDMVKKVIFHEKELDEIHLMKELGDVMWYVAMFCSSMGWNLDEILQMNIEKLKNRYPEGFDVNRANNRKQGDV